MNMYSKFAFALILSGVLFALGCNKAIDQPAVSETGPLTLEEWRQLSPSVRFDIEFIDRLKEGVPELKTKKGWKAFTESELKQGASKPK